jgi:hypothetical protein
MRYASTQRPVRLFRAADAESAWQGVVKPWLRDRAAGAWKHAAPTVLAAPTPRAARFVRDRLVAEGASLFGVRVLAHGDLWRLLHRHFGGGAAVATREDLHLLLAAAAAQQPDHPSAQSTAADPAPLMRALDLLAAAGWPDSEMPVRGLRPTLDAFARARRDAGLRTAQETDREMLAAARAGQPAFHALLLFGFDARYGSVWTPLRAAVAAAADATVCLMEPRVAGAQADETWIGSWEEAYGEAAPVPPAADAVPFRSLAEALDTGERASSAAPVVHIGEDTREEAHAIAAQALAYLAEPGCARLGILFPGPGPLARETAARLDAWGVPHDDAFGARAALDPADAPWEAWLRFQTQPLATELLDLLRACPGLAESLGARSAHAIERLLERAYAELMVDDLAVLGAYLDRELGARELALPAQASFHAFVEATLAQFARRPELAPGDRAGELRARAAAFGAGWTAELTREAFARWLAAVTLRPGREPAATGRHPYARVHLAAYEDAEWQTWSHLILAGLNRNAWPPEARAEPFLDQATVERLHRAAVRQGRQGEGHRTVVEGKGLLVGPAERAAHLRRQFQNVLESATRGLCLTASRTRADAPGQNWNPSDLLVRVHAAVHGSALSDERMRALRDATAHWLATAAPGLARLGAGAPAPAAPLAVARTREAWLARRDPDRPFGPFEFGLAAAPPRPVTLSCTDWERALACPERVWMEHFLGVSEPRWNAAEMPHAALLGNWVHRWLHRALNARADGAELPALQPVPDAAAMRARVLAAHGETHDRAARAFAAAGRPLPHWWRGLLTQARIAALALADAIAAARDAGWPLAASEWALPAGTRAALPGDAEPLPVTGRMDLLLAAAGGGPFCVVDYKTGAPPPLTPATLGAGQGVQLLLYALALRGRGLREVSLAVASPGDPLEPRAELDAWLADERVAGALAAIGRMQATGVFGMAGDPRAEFGFRPEYPLAWLPVNAEVLRRKRALTLA